MTPSKLQDARSALTFLLAGNAYATFVSHATGTRFTYRISLPKTRRDPKVAPPHFVAVLTGPDNSESYTYIGCIPASNLFHYSRKSSVAGDAPSVKAFEWVWRRLAAGHVPETVDIMHAGRCGRCGRRLTVPESLETGLGPECAQKGAKTA